MGEERDQYAGWVGDAAGLRVAIVAARWHATYMDGMLTGA